MDTDKEMIEKLYEISFQIISFGGSACSKYMEAIAAAKTGNFKEAEKCMQGGDELYVQGHNAHADLIQKEAAGEYLPFCIIFMHSEDQMMKTEMIKLMAQEFIDLYKKVSV